MVSVTDYTRNGIIKQPRKFAIFMNNGDIITLDAMTFNWDDDGTLCFYGDEEEDSLIAIFKQDVLYGISICNYEIHKDQLLLPKYEESETKE